jgi:hypothetical protein
VTRCNCIDRLELPDAKSLWARYLAKGDTIHTAEGCYHASLLDAWRHKETLSAALEIIADGESVPPSYRALASRALADCEPRTDPASANQGDAPATPTPSLPKDPP